MNVQRTCRIPERRHCARLECDQETVIPAARFGEALHAARIRNISTDGIAAVVDQEIPPETQLTIELFNRTRSYWRLTAMRVVYATREHEGGWSIGCSFLRPLPHQEVQELLGQDAENQAS